MKQDHLGQNFILTSTWIEPRYPDRLDEVDFRASVIQFFENAKHVKVRKGDLLNEFKRRYPTSIRGLISDLNAKDLAALKSGYNNMSFAKRYKPGDRVPNVSDGHMEILLSVDDDRERIKLQEWVVNGNKNGKPVSVKTLKAAAEKAKLRTNQLPRKARKKPR
jgi:hypothetical protein